MKRTRFYTMIAALLFIMVTPMFAYDGFKFDENGSFNYGNMWQGNGIVADDATLFRDFNIIDESKLIEVVVDREAYQLLYNASFSKDGKERDWCVIETTDFIGVKRHTKYWTEYHLYRKVEE